MSTAAITSKGIILKQGSTAIAEVTNVSINLKNGTQDVTSHASASAQKEFISTLKEFSLTLDINYVPANATHKNASGGLLYALDQQSTNPYTLIWSDGAATTWGPFNAIITDFQVKGVVNGHLTASLTLQGTGSPALA